MSKFSIHPLNYTDTLITLYDMHDNHVLKAYTQYYDGSMTSKSYNIIIPQL